MGVSERQVLTGGFDKLAWPTLFPRPPDHQSQGLRSSVSVYAKGLACKDDEGRLLAPLLLPGPHSATRGQRYVSFLFLSSMAPRIVSGVKGSSWIQVPMALQIALQ